jgi:hypothetical protein
MPAGFLACPKPGAIHQSHIKGFRMLDELEARARRKPALIDDTPERRSARSYADLQSAARHFDAKRYDYLADQLERAGMKDKAALARRWSREHILVAAQLRRLGAS